jgi:hypothetical protein
MTKGFKRVIFETKRYRTGTDKFPGWEWLDFFLVRKYKRKIFSISNRVCVRRKELETR